MYKILKGTQYVYGKKKKKKVPPILALASWFLLQKHLVGTFSFVCF